MSTKTLFRRPFPLSLLALALSAAAIFFYSCNSSAGSPSAAIPVQSLPVVTVTQMPATTYQEYTASLEGSRDIEIRAQVDGYLEKIFVDEGAFVKKGQPLFSINNRPYEERLNNARASLAAAKANQASAEINVAKLTPLVENKVISEVQLRAAEASLNAAKASVQQAEALSRGASIDLGYTIVEAPADGYVGRLPFKTGSLVGSSILTILSEIDEVYAYFSLSENDFLKFENQFSGRTVAEKIKQMPQVELVLADNSVYPSKGRVEAVSGQFGDGTGAISFRAVFDNRQGLLRSGNTGKIRIPQSISSAFVIPQEATFELQDKVFVFTVNDSNVVSSVPITVSSTAGNYYLVEKGLSSGARIVFAGFSRLGDGMPIAPIQLSMDSILRARPM